MSSDPFRPWDAGYDDIPVLADPLHWVRILVEAAEVSITNGLPVDLPEFVAGLRNALDGDS